MTERLDRIEALVERNSQAIAQHNQSMAESNARMTQLEQQLAQQSVVATQRLDRLDQLITVVTESNIELKQNTAQLKRAVDYLMSRDGSQS